MSVEPVGVCQVNLTVGECQMILPVGVCVTEDCYLCQFLHSVFSVFLLSLFFFLPYSLFLSLRPLFLPVVMVIKRIGSVETLDRQGAKITV